MIGIAVTTTSHFDRVQKAQDKGTVRNLQRAAFRYMTEARSLIKDAPGPSAPGTPPHTHTAGVFKKGKRAGQAKLGYLPRSYGYAVDKTAKEAVSGPRFSVIGPSAAAHEHGEELRGDDYPERSTATPALAAIAPEFGSSFANSLG
jgi:hypothetical protein